MKEREFHFELYHQLKSLIELNEKYKNLEIKPEYSYSEKTGITKMFADLVIFHKKVNVPILSIEIKYPRDVFRKLTKTKRTRYITQIFKQGYYLVHPEYVSLCTPKELIIWKYYHDLGKLADKNIPLDEERFVIDGHKTLLKKVFSTQKIKDIEKLNIKNKAKVILDTILTLCLEKD